MKDVLLEYKNMNLADLRILCYTSDLYLVDISIILLLSLVCLLIMVTKHILRCTFYLKLTVNRLYTFVMLHSTEHEIPLAHKKLNC